MNDSLLTPEERFATVRAAFRNHPKVALPTPDERSQKRFGADTLKVGDKIFAMLVRDTFVVKLPQQRVADLVAAGAGSHFDSGNGRLMKEWVAIAPMSEREWLPLAEEALAFVASQSPKTANI